MLGTSSGGRISLVEVPGARSGQPCVLRTVQSASDFERLPHKSPAVLLAAVPFWFLSRGLGRKKAVQLAGRGAVPVLVDAALRSPRSSLVLQRAKGTAVKGDVLLEFQDAGHPYRLLDWPLPAHALSVVAWLDGWESQSSGNQETNFWRQRMVMAMKSRCEKIAFGDDDFRSSSSDSFGNLPKSKEGKKPAKPPFQVFALHKGGDVAEPPLAIAFVSESPFPLEPVKALHLDQLVRSPSPEAQGAGKLLLKALLRRASDTQHGVLAVEPQSPGLETYFSHLGFRPVKEIDPFLWFVGGQADVELRFGLCDQEDHERLLATFKRPPDWISQSEEAFITRWQDAAALDVLAVRVASRANGRPRATAQRFRRKATTTDPYEADAPEDVDVSEAMSVMRGPDMLMEVDWPLARDLKVVEPTPESAEDLQRTPTSRSFSGLGRCSIAQRAYPLPGLPNYCGRAELVIDVLELPMRNDAVYSVAVTCQLAALPDVLDVMRRLLNDFRVRAAFCRNPPAWNLEVSQSDGLSAFALQSTRPLLPGEEDPTKTKPKPQDESELDFM